MFSKFLQTLGLKSREHHGSYVFRIYGNTHDHVPTFLGTGFLIAPQWVVTCKHVVVEKAPYYGETQKRLQEQLFVQLEDSIDSRISIPHAKVKLHEDYDIALIELSNILDISYPPLVRGVTRALRERIKEITCSAIGYKMSTQGRVRGESFIKLRMPEFKDGETHHLIEIQFKGSPSIGYSGGPLIYSTATEDVCAGVLYLGSEGASTARVFSSDEIYHFINKHTTIKPSQVDAQRIFAKKQKQKQKSLSSSLNFIPQVALALTIIIFCLAGLKEYRATRRLSYQGSTTSISDASSKLTTHDTDPNECDGKIPQNILASVAKFKILIISFYGVDAESRHFGRATALGIHTAFESYKAQEVQSTEWSSAHLTDEGVKAYPLLDCYVNDDGTARRIGEIAKVDLVIWGRAGFEKIPASAGTGDFTPFITAVSLPSLHSVAAQSVGPIGRHTLTKMTFPQLTTDRIFPFVQLIFGLYAYGNQRYTLAAKYLKEVTNSQVPGILKIPQLRLIQAHSLMNAGQYEISREILNSLKQICATLSSKLETECLAYTLYLEAINLWKQGDLAKAQHIMSNEVLPRAEQLEEPDLYYIAVTDLSKLAAQNGNTNEAIHLATLAVKAVIPTSDLPCINCSMAGLSDWHSTVSGDLQSVLKIYEEGKKTWEPNQDYRSKAAAAINIATVYIDKANYIEAIEWYKKALSNFEILGILPDIGSLNFAISLASEKLHNLSDAKKHAQKALNAFHQAGLVSSEALATSRLALLYISESNQERAKQLLSNLQLNEQNSIPQDIDTHVSAAVAYAQLKYYGSALQHVQLAIKLTDSLHLNKNQLPEYYLKQAYYFENLKKIDAATKSLMAGADFLFNKDNEDDTRLQAFEFLDYACEVAMRNKRPAICQNTLDSVRGFYGYPVVYALKTKARLSSRLGRFTQAKKNYDELIDLWRDKNAKVPKLIENIVRAGYGRIQSGGKFDRCFGILVTAVKQSEPSLLSIQPGDVILRYNTECVSSLTDYDFFTQSTRPKDAIIKIWRSGEYLLLKLTPEDISRIHTTSF